MKIRYFLLISFLFTATFCFAQNKLFDKYADMDHITCINITKTMFEMMPEIQTNGLNMMNLKGKIESLQILTTENAEQKNNLRKDFLPFTGKEYEELMRIKSDSTKANFYVKKKGEQISELILLADHKDNFSVIRLLGNFTLQDIQNIAKEIQK